MGLVTSDNECNADVAEVQADKVVNSPEFGVLGRCILGELVRLGANLSRRLNPFALQTLVPAAYLFPGLETREQKVRGRKLTASCLISPFFLFFLLVRRRLMLQLRTRPGKYPALSRFGDHRLYRWTLPLHSTVARDTNLKLMLQDDEVRRQLGGAPE